MSRKTLTRSVALCSALVLWSTSVNLAIAAPASQAEARDSLATAVQVTISVAEARRIAVNNNLTGRRSLPPGIQRNLARGKAVPPGIARQLVPQSMLSALPAYPEHEWRIAGDDLLLIALGTQLVVEILSDVFR